MLILVSECNVRNVESPQSVDLPKWMLQIRTAQYLLFDYLEYTIGDFEDEWQLLYQDPNPKLNTS